MPYDKENLKDILLQSDCQTLDENGKVLPPSSAVFRTIANRMASRGSHIDPRHVYTIVNEDRNGFRTLIATALKVNRLPSKNANNSDPSFGLNVSTDTSFNASDCQPMKKFKLFLSPDNWKEIAPKKIISSGRAYWKFQEGWADVIADKICQQQTTVECVFSFKNNVTRLTAAAKSYSTFVGYCTECKAIINGELEKKPQTDVDVMFLCRIDGIQANLHTGAKTRQLRGKRREEIATAMIEKGKSAVVIRRDMARRLKDFGGKNPATIPKGDVLRKAKEQQQLKMYGLEFAFGPLNLLRKAKIGDHAGFIHSIGLLKFYCMYWTPEQEKIYTARCKKDPEATLTIDATGGIAKREHKGDPYVFLYQCMLVTKEGSVPVFQMVSGDQRSFQIAHFLRVILAKGVPRPPIVVCDFGRALVNAVAEILGSCCSLTDYLDRCYAIVMQKPANIPTTYLRLDVSHVTAMVSRWKCLKSTVYAGQQLYQRCISQAYQMSDFTELTYFLESVLIVCLSEYVGKSKDRSLLQSEIRMQHLDDTIEGTEFMHIKNNSDEPTIVDDDFSEDASISGNNWKKWADTLYDSARGVAKTCVDGNRINACFNPDFALRLSKQLLPFLPLWTGIMRQHFTKGSTIATSSSVEAEFCDLKHRSFANKLPMRIDLFILKHLDHLDGKVKLASNRSDALALEREVPANETNLNLNRREEAAESSLESASSSSDCHKSAIESVASNNSSGNDSAAEDSAGMSISEEKQVSTTNEESLDDRSDQVPTTIDDTTDDQIQRTIDDTTDDQSFRSSTPDECADWNATENWRGKASTVSSTVPQGAECLDVIESNAMTIPVKRTAESIESPAKKRRKPTKLDKCPEWKCIKDTKSCKLPLLKNGNSCSSVKMGTYSLNLRNTCAFDSIFQIIVSAIASNQKYAERFKETQNRIVQFAQNLVNGKQQLTTKSYAERAHILVNLNMFKTDTFTRTIKRLDAKCNVVHLADYLFADVPTVKTDVSCSCGNKFVRDDCMLSIDVNVPLCEGFEYLQKAIDQGRSKRRLCPQCGSTIQDKIEYGPHIMIDTCVLTDRRYTVRNENLRHTLGSMAKTVLVGGNTYALAGLVHYIPGHYVAYVKSGMYWYEYDDCQTNIATVPSNRKVQPHLIVYVCV